MTKKDEFIALCKEHITQDTTHLIQWLEDAGFFTAPASTKYHGAYQGGLCEHSINVFNMLSSNNCLMSKEDMEKIAIVSLFHDICKCNFYKTDYRNVKNERTGVWEKVPYYTVDEELPFGHGEKSVYILSQFLSLTRDEALAIRWHMGGFDIDARCGGNSVSAAFAKCPLALELHIADMRATYLVDKNSSRPESVNHTGR